MKVDNIRNRTHGGSKTRTYVIWCAIKQRCLNPNNPAFKYYGGRGITICDRWKDSFENFLSDMGEPETGLTIDRTDNSLGYCPDNCKWVSRAHQQSNRRNNRFLTHNGITQTAMAWANQLGIPHQTIYNRIELGWPLDDILLPEKQIDKSGLSLGGLANGARNKAKTHCKFGHEFSEANTYINSKGRKCRRCAADREARKRNG
jgi:hypothetical protein